MKRSGMRVFKTKPFSRFAGHEGIDDDALCDAVRRAENGLINADLGGGVIKQRLAREGQGKSGGFRSIILFRRAEKAVFAYGFAKNDRDNIKRDELTAFRKLADQMLGYDDKALAAAMKNGTITEIMCHG
jgi:hypothetical protein